MSLGVKIEIRSTVKKKANCFADGNTHDFIVYVQGHNGNHIEHFIKEIVFYLPFNSNSKQVRRKPPYSIQGSTHTSFRLPIDLFFHTSTNLNKMRYSYYLVVPDKPLEKATCVKTLTFLNAPQDFKERLLLGGAEEVRPQMNSDVVATRATCKSEPVDIIENQDVSIQEEFHNQLPTPCIQSEGTSVQSSSSINQSTHRFDELLKENGILKEESETLNKKFGNLQSVITTYVEKLPVLENEFSSVTAELNELNQKAETNEAKISTLKSDVQLLMAEILQHKNKVNEVSGKMKRQETSAVSSSSFASEGFKSSLSLENESSTSILSAEKGRTVMNKSVNKKLHENLNEGSVQYYARSKQSESQRTLSEASDADHTALNPEKTNIEKLSTQNGCLFRQADKNAIEEMGFQECMKDEPKMNKVSKSNEQYVEDKLQIITEKKNKEHSNLSHEKRDTLLTFTKIDLHQKAIEETANNYKTDEIQNFLSNRKGTHLTDLSFPKRGVNTFNTKTISVEKDDLQISSFKRKDIESVDSDYQGRDSVVSNFIHLQNPPLNRKRARFLPIFEDKEELCRTNTSVQQNDHCLIPCIASSDIPESSKHLTCAEQICLPIKSSLSTITCGNKGPYPFPGYINDVDTEYDTSNSLHRNLHYVAENNTKQSFSSCIATNEQFGKFTQNRLQNKGFKNPKSQTDSRFAKTVQTIFKDIDERQISDSDSKSYVHSLFRFLVNPANSPNISTLIFHVINHLSLTRRNYLKAFKNDRDNCIFLPSSESCIVTTLFEIEKKSKTYSQLKLIENILSIICELVIAKKRFNLNGIASLCRVFTEICKRKKDLLSPLSLCAVILKIRLYYAPYLIASIVGVWKEPFIMPSEHSVETMALIGAILLRVHKGTEDVAKCLGKSYLGELIEYFELPSVNIDVNLVKDKIVSNCTQNSHEKTWMLTSSLVILAAHEPWNWTQKKLIDEFILPNLSRFSSQEPNGKAFGVFCDLYVDVYLLRPNKPSKETRITYFENVSNKGIDFVKEWAKVSLVKYLILKRRPIPGYLSEWLERNKRRPIVEKFSEFYQRRNIYSNEKFLKLEDIVIT